MDNDESIFSSQNSIIGFIFLGCITLYTIYYIYSSINQDSNQNNAQNKENDNLGKNKKPQVKKNNQNKKGNM